MKLSSLMSILLRAFLTKAGGPGGRRSPGVYRFRRRGDSGKELIFRLNQKLKTGGHASWTLGLRTLGQSIPKGPYLRQQGGRVQLLWCFFYRATIFVVLSGRSGGGES